MTFSANIVRLIAVAGALALVAPEAVALPVPRPPMPSKPGVQQPGQPAKPKGRSNKNKNSKPQNPLETAVKDLEAAEKDIDGKNFSDASSMTKSAEQIVDQQAKAAKGKDGKGGNKDRADALGAILKDIKEAQKQIAARKSADATTALQGAVAGLETLIGGKGKGKKKN
ncbi:MAG TPA: hypothetical protein VKE40_21185 [Gemmataceae bacterium]|nr:hypothetical protein [Gemmataceae bacterium]